MSIKYAEEFRDGVIAKDLADKIRQKSKKNIRIMEVCGTHTMSIFKNGIRSVLPETITLLSGPGCPVCVTSQGEIDAFVNLSEKEDVIFATFGDLIRVPGSDSSLQKKQAEGFDIRIVYSCMDALQIAKDNPDKTIVFPGVGFETTAPGTAATIISAKQQGVTNFCVLSAQKTVPPALFGLMNIPKVEIDGFLLPGHVAVITGQNAFIPFINKYNLPCVIAGFEPADILMGLLELIESIESNKYSVKNAYTRAVSTEGNVRAREILYEVFKPCDAQWRGIGTISGSGLSFKSDYEDYDAVKRFGLDISINEKVKGCSCGEILTGLKTPPDCSLYKKACTPLNPIGPCMVSSEGTCAAYYKYQ